MRLQKHMMQKNQARLRMRHVETLEGEAEAVNSVGSDCEDDGAKAVEGWSLGMTPGPSYCNDVSNERLHGERRVRVAMRQRKRMAVLDEREEGDLDTSGHVDVVSIGGREKKRGGRTAASGRRD